MKNAIRNTQYSILIALILSCLILPQAALAANHYIRDGASGDGSDWNNAWDDLPANLTRGDTYYIADGTYGKHTFNDALSGSTYIYVKKAITSDHGADTGWQTSYGDGQAVFLFEEGSGMCDRFRFTQGYYVIDGQVGGGPTSWKTGHGFKLVGWTDGDISCDLIDLGNGTNGDTPTPNIQIKHCEITCEPYFEHNTTDYGSGIYQQIIMPYGTKNNGPHDCVLSYNYIHDIGEPLHTAFCKDWLVEYNYFARNETSPPNSNQGAIWWDTASDNMIVRYNIFEDGDGTYVIDMKGGVGIFFPHDGWEIYGNVFFYTPTHPTVGCSTCEPPYEGGMGNGIVGCCANASVTNMKVYNNTFINHFGAAVGVNWWTDVNTGNVLYNNIWLYCNQDATYSWHKGIDAPNYNWYYGNYQGGQPYDNVLAAFEANSQIGTGDPFTDWANGDFSLTAPTNAGKSDLGSPYNVDMFGNVRGADGVWDRGAIEFVPEPPVYYIRSDAPTGGDGSDWNNAWQDLNNATRPDSTLGLVRGATYYIADGTYGGYTFDDPEDGEKYIYIKKAIESDHGTSVGWQARCGDGVAEFVMNEQIWYGGSEQEALYFLTSYYVFDGQTGGGPGSWDSGYGFKLIVGNTVKISDYRGLIRFGLSWELNTIPDYIQIKHVEMTSPYRTKYNGDVAVQHSLVPGLVANDAGPQNITISYCYIHDISKHLKMVEGDHWLIEYNYFARDDVDRAGGNQGEAFEDFGSDDMIVRYNIFEDIEGTGNIALKSGVTGQFSAPSQNWEIYGNIFFWTPGFVPEQGVGVGIIVDTGDEGIGPSEKSGMKIYNNVFANITGYGAGINFTASTTVRNEAYNNIWYDCNARAQNDFFGGVDDHDYNWFYGNIREGANYDSALNASEPHAQVGTQEPFTNRNNRDFRLKGPTNPGLTLGAPYNKDMFGVTRGADGNWDRGAIEFVSAGVILYGDVSGDADISAYDAALTAQYAVALISLTPDQIKAADVSGDNEVSAYDAALIAQRAVGLIDKFPVEG